MILIVMRYDDISTNYYYYSSKNRSTKQIASNNSSSRLVGPYVFRRKKCFICKKKNSLQKYIIFN